MLPSPLPSYSSPVTFDIVVVGSGGGPDETNLSGYLVKPHDADWEDGIFALEAGSGQGALAQLLRKDPLIFRDKIYSPSEIYSFVRCFLLTHAHLDHINSLVVSAGSLRGSRKRVFALKQTLQDLETVFSDRIWPNLASWKEDDDEVKLLYSTLCSDGKYKVVFPDVAVRTMPLSHGHNDLGQYTSAAFFIRHEPSLREFLFFGDVEPDSVANAPQTINVWRVAASKIPETLSTIFIECSYPSGRKDHLLFGHLTPEHLGMELSSLAAEVVKYKQNALHLETRKRPVRKKQKRNSLTADDLRGALAGVRIFIIHCKDDFAVDESRPIREVIAEQVRQIVDDKGLGAKIVVAEQGMRIEI
ncbi:cAMP phosphodiesterases class-II-domain-containing protein [Crassisporium funariophilum]|nr:cAMP phosphodiesterases class-II-domain-containing protein [Crassisporium funariophilum]